MIAETVKQAMEQQLIRGTRVVVGESFRKPGLRGEEMIVASRGLVKCNGKGRCAGDWCAGLAVFLADPETVNEEKEMGWRGGTKKVCLTHLRTPEGDAVLPPPALQVAAEALEKQGQTTPTANPYSSTGVVTWEELAQTVADKDWTRLTYLARKLKRENEDLKVKVIAAQEKLIEHLQAR